MSINARKYAKKHKKLFKVTNSDTGPQMSLLTEGAKLNPGDKLHVRIELRVDRAMEYVHMKDMRASGFEPMNVLSSYKWQGGLGYYESTRDAATNFFIQWLKKPGWRNRGQSQYSFFLRTGSNLQLKNMKRYIA